MGMLRPFVGALVVAVALAGCAVAEKSGFGGRPDSGIRLVDTGGGGGGGDGMSIDAPPAPGEKMLVETMSMTDEQVGIACGPNDGVSTYTLRNSYYRVFALADYGISGAFHVTDINFVVSASAGNIPLKVSVGTYSGTLGGATLVKADIASLNSMMITVNDGDTSEDVPLTADIPAGGNVVVEIDQATAGNNTNNYEFYIGANTEGETSPGYVSSADCSIAQPTSMTQEAGSEADEIVWVVGTT